MLNRLDLKNSSIEILSPLQSLITVNTVMLVLGLVFIFASVDCVIPEIVHSLFIVILFCLHSSYILVFMACLNNILSPVKSITEKFLKGLL